MIITSVGKDTAIRQNIINTIAQIVEGGAGNKRLVLPHNDPLHVVVNFYADESMLHLVFSEDSNVEVASFNLQSTYVQYTPPQSKINFTPEGVSTLYCLPLYWVKATFEDGTSVTTTYKNKQNMLFESVISTPSEEPAYGQNADSVYVVPKGRTLVNPKYSDDLRWVILNYVLIVPFNIFAESTNLSEDEKLSVAENWFNSIADALYTDRYRNGNCTFLDKDLDGTEVDRMEIDSAHDCMKCRVRCCYMASSTAY